MDTNTSATETAEATEIVADSAPQTEAAEAVETTQVATPTAPTTEAAPSQLHNGVQTKTQSGTPAPAQPQQPAPINWQKRYEDQQPYLTKSRQEIAEMRKQYDGLDPVRAREALADMERRAQAANASPFSRRNPEYGQNKSRIDRADMFLKAAEGMDNDQARQMAARMGVTAEDLSIRNQANAYREQMQEQLFSDPDAFIAERVESLVQQKLSEHAAFLEGRTNAEKWLSDPKNDQIVKSYATDINRLVDSNVPLRDKVAFLGEKLSRLEALEKQLGQQAETVSQANAQQAALSSRSQGATRRGNTTASRVTDAAKYVTETLKIKRTDPKYIQAIQETNEKIRSHNL